jgi:predicted transcriptional regulator
MKRTTVSLPDDLADAVEREARRRSVSVSALAREALSAHLGLASDRPRHLAFAAVGRSGRRTVARDMEDLISVEWDGEPGGR